MATTDATGSRSRYAEAVLLGLLAHELVAGVVFWAIGFHNAGRLLWVLGTGLAAGYALVRLAWEARAPRRWPRLGIAAAMLAAMIVATIFEVFLVSDALGTVLVAAVFFGLRHPEPPAPHSVASVPRPSSTA